MPYKGTAPIIAGLMGNEVQFAALDFASAQAGMKNASCSVQTGTKRLPSLPDVPTLAETGLRNFDPSFWVGLAVPKNTPDDAVRQLNTALNAAIAQKPLQGRAWRSGGSWWAGRESSWPTAICAAIARPTARSADIKASCAGLLTDVACRALDHVPRAPASREPGADRMSGNGTLHQPASLGAVHAEPAQDRRRPPVPDGPAELARKRCERLRRESRPQ